MFNHLPTSGNWGDDPIVADNINYGYLYYYTVEGKEIPVLGLYHPSSSSFNYSLYPFIQEAFNRI